MANPFISLEGFDYFLDLLYRPNVSRELIEDLLESLFDINVVVRPISFEENKRKARKEQQVSCFLSLMSYLNLEGRIVDFCCGSGNLTSEVARRFPNQTVIGVDINEELISKNNHRYHTIPNLEFISEDILSASELLGNTALSLHACGNLTDEVLEKGYKNVICVPCCYTKLEIKKPRSLTLKKREEFYFKIIQRLKRLEGIVKQNERSSRRVLRDAYRMLIDYDRMLFLLERGYSTKIAKFHTGTCYGDSRGTKNSSFNVALIGEV